MVKTIAKRIITISILIILSLLVLYQFTPTVAFAREREIYESPIITFSQGETDNENEIKIIANMIDNTGILAMVVSVDYDKDAFILKEVTRGDALGALEFEKSGTYTTYPYKLMYEGRQNDYSTGVMVEMIFEIKENAPDGEYYVTFGYERNRDVIYFDGERLEKNLLVGKAKVVIDGEDTVIEQITPEDNGEQGKNGLDKASIIMIAVSSVLAVGFILTIVLVIKSKRKKNKEKWIKV